MLRISLILIVTGGLLAGFPLVCDSPVFAETVSCCCDGCGLSPPPPDPRPEYIRDPCEDPELLWTRETADMLPDFGVPISSATYYNNRLRPYAVMEPVDPIFEINNSDLGSCCGQADHSYTIKFSAKESILQFPDDPNVATQAMWDSAYQRIADRNTPWIEVTNNPESDSVITQYMMTIGDEAFHFSDVRFGDYIYRSNTDEPHIWLEASVSDDKNTLTVDIPGGLMPGEVVRFRIDIDPDDPSAFSHPDYRTVLFSMNGSGTTDNSVVTVENTFCTCPIPEPGTMALLTILAVGLGLAKWRRREQPIS